MEPGNGAVRAQGGRTEDFPRSEKVEGPISAAIIAAGFGAAVLGLLTTLAEASTAVSDGLNWNNAVGPLSGKTTLAVVVWLLAWGVLHTVLRNRPYETVRALVLSLVLIALGILGTFPPFFQLFA